MVSQSTYRNVCLIALLVTITASIVIVSGCGTTQQANLWVDPSYNAAPMKKILVIAMRKDQLKRRMWEDAIVTTLGSKEHAGYGCRCLLPTLPRTTFPTLWPCALRRKKKVSMVSWSLPGRSVTRSQTMCRAT